MSEGVQGLEGSGVGGGDLHDDDDDTYMTP